MILDSELYSVIILSNGVIYSILVTFGIISNLLVLYYYIIKKKKKSKYNIFIILLATVDLIACLLILLTVFSMLKVITASWNQLFFLMLERIREIPTLVSCWLIVGMSFERYVGISNPLSDRITRKHVTVYFIVTVIIASGFTLNILIAPFSKTSRYEIIYIIAWYLLKFLIPVSLMCWFFQCIKRVLTQQEQSLHNSKVHKRNIKIMSVLKILIISYVVCVGSYTTVSFVTKVMVWENKQNFQRLKHFSTYFIVDFIVRVVMSLNYTVNCFVYAGYNEDFRKFILNIV